MLVLQDTEIPEDEVLCFMAARALQHFHTLLQIWGLHLNANNRRQEQQTVHNALFTAARLSISLSLTHADQQHVVNHYQVCFFCQTTYVS